MTKTWDHYNTIAPQYMQINHTLTEPLEELSPFLSLLRATVPASQQTLSLLDAGSGTGRDTLATLKAGCRVDAFDGSTAMAKISSKLTGQATRVMRFEHLGLPVEHYDGVWAMASLLHVQRPDLPGVLAQLGKALRPHGLLYASFTAMRSK